MHRSILSLYAGFIFTILFTSTNLLYAQWMQTNGYNGTIHSVFVNDTNLFAGTNGGGVYLSSNYGTSWAAVDSGLTGSELYVNSFASLGPNIFAGTRSGIFVSTNDGIAWKEVDSGLTSSLSRYILSFAVIGSNLFAGTQGGGVYLSTNNGTSWTGVNTDLQLPYVSSLAVIGTNLFAGTEGDGVYFSSDSGGNWAQVNNGLVLGGLSISSLAASDTNLFTGTNLGLFLSTNNGSNWIEADSGLMNAIVNTLVFNRTNYFAGTNAGVFLSTNHGTSWSSVNSGLNQLGVQSLAIIGDTLFAGSGGGVWKRPLSDMITSVNQTPSNFPTNFNLEQNYPNPFNPSTTINYSLPKASLVTIKVYDILGREIATLVNQQKNPGNYEVQFNASKLASGVYFYRMQAGDFVETKKLLLLK